MEKAEKQPVKATPIQVANAVFWAFFGVRKKSDHAADVESLTLGQVVIGGVIGAALFVGSLLLLVNFMTS